MTPQEKTSARVVSVPVGTGRQVAGSWGRAHRLAAATVADGPIVDWTEHDVRWDTLHDSGTEGSPHARVARFLVEHHVDAVVAARMIDKLGIRARLGEHGDAEAAVLAAAQD